MKLNFGNYEYWHSGRHWENKNGLINCNCNWMWKKSRPDYVIEELKLMTENEITVVITVVRFEWYRREYEYYFYYYLEVGTLNDGWKSWSCSAELKFGDLMEGFLVCEFCYLSSEAHAHACE